MKSLKNAIETIHLLDDLAGEDTVLTRLSPLAKLGSLFIFLAALASLGPEKLTNALLLLWVLPVWYRLGRLSWKQPLRQLGPVIAQNGTAVIGSLAKVILCAYIAYALHAILVYSLAVRAIGGMSPLKFFKGMMPAMLFAFSSASSVGTLPINMECANKLGASKEVTSFALPLGATINMDGTAIYQGVCAVFIASCYGIDLTMSQMLTIVVTATLASVGTAGVPGAGMIMLAMVLASVNLPVDGIALVAGVDRIFDMGRTTLNITGDASCAIIVTHLLEKEK